MHRRCGFYGDGLSVEREREREREQSLVLFKGLWDPWDVYI